MHCDTDDIGHAVVGQIDVINVVVADKILIGGDAVEIGDAVRLENCHGIVGRSGLLVEVVLNHAEFVGIGVLCAVLNPAPCHASAALESSTSCRQWR